MALSVSSVCMTIMINLATKEGSQATLIVHQTCKLKPDYMIYPILLENKNTALAHLAHIRSISVDLGLTACIDAI